MSIMVSQRAEDKSTNIMMPVMAMSMDGRMGLRFHSSIPSFSLVTRKMEAITTTRTQPRVAGFNLPPS